MARSFLQTSTGTLVALLVLSGSQFAGAMGYYNLPGNSWQWWGHGFSGGYHAPFVLGPIAQNSHPWPNVHRQPYAPNPYACAPCYAGGSYETTGANLQEPTILSPSELPTPQQSTPTPAGTTPDSPPRSSMLVRPAKY